MPSALEPRAELRTIARPENSVDAGMSQRLEQQQLTPSPSNGSTEGPDVLG